MRFAFIASKTGRFPTAWMCRRVGVSPSGFYAWKTRKPSARALRDAQLRLKLRAFHAASHGTYGRPRLWQDLRDDGEAVSEKRVARLMRQEGLFGRLPKRWKKTTRSDHEHGYAPNVVKQNFGVDARNRLWVADLSYVRTWQGWVYLAVIVDAFSRRAVGYAVDDHMRTDLTLEALRMAIRRRRPSPGLVHHSDRGVQYASKDYQDVLAEIGATPSMSDTGNCFDNAMAESFFSTIKEELIYRHSWPTKSLAARSIGNYIEDFYNCRRRHSSIGNVSPMEYEVATLRRLAA